MNASLEKPVSFGYRMRVMIGLLAGLRRHDLRSAGTFMHVQYKGQPWLMRCLRFTGWSLRQMWITIPNAMPGIDTSGAVSRTPHWLTASNPLANHPWQTQPHAALPQEVDTVVIGAGFTGASAVYHWARRTAATGGSGGRTLVVLEMKEAADGASGRNLGTIVMGRYFTMVRDTVVEHLAKARKDLSAQKQKCLAEQFADVYCRAAKHNYDLIEQTINEEGFDVDHHRNGWIQERHANQQEELSQSVAEGKKWGHTDWLSISPERVFEEIAMRVDHPAGFSQRAGTWHPAKWVWSLLVCALRQPNVEFFSHTKVLRVEHDGQGHVIHTNRGVLRAKHIIYSVESQLPAIDVRFRNIIEAHQEQISSGLGAPEAMPSNNSHTGQLFFGARRGDILLAGSDSTHVPDRLAGGNNPSRFLTKFCHAEHKRVYGPYRFKLTNEWSGTVGYTPDQYPIIGPLDDRGQYVIGGMCGSGSGVAFNAARCIVNRILDLNDESDDYPEAYFAPSRLLDPQNHRWPDISLDD